MKSRFPLVLVLAVGLASLGLAQKLTPEQRAQSDRVLAKVRKLEIMNQVLPLLLTPDQAKLFLPILEKHRGEADRLEVDEHKLVLTLEKDLDAQIKTSGETGAMPDEAVMKNVLVHFRMFSLRRKSLLDDTALKLMALMKEKLNAGQVRAAANSFSPAVFGLEVDKETITEDKRLDYWIRLVLMDNDAYPVMVELSKKKS
jgi:hypothetical protein